MSALEQLKPCPFCGGTGAAIIEGTDDGGQFVAVGCPDCGVGTRQFYGLMEDPKPHATCAWNSRAALKEGAK